MCAFVQRCLDADFKFLKLAELIFVPDSDVFINVFQFALKSRALYIDLLLGI